MSLGNKGRWTHKPAVPLIYIYYECSQRLHDTKGLEKKAQNQNTDLVIIPVIMTSQLPNFEDAVFIKVMLIAVINKPKYVPWHKLPLA